MKVLSLTQPWATLMAIGAKRIETRGWGTAYRGDVAIHAALGFPKEAHWACLREPVHSVLAGRELPRGAIVCVVRLIEVRTFGSDVTSDIAWLVAHGAEHERAFGDYGIDRRAWLTTDLRVLATPMPWKGAQGLRDLPVDVAASLLDRPAAPVDLVGPRSPRV